MPSQAQFRIDGLDCAEEVLVLRRELEGRSGVVRLEFDVLNARMSVEYDAKITSPQEMIEVIRRTGMHARPYEPRAATDASSPWQRHGRAVMTAAAGGLLAVGLLLHWRLRGSLTAALGHDATHHLLHLPPLGAGVAYLGSIIAGAWFVAPKAWLAVRRLRADMNLLMIVAVIGALILGEWFEACTVTFLFSLALLLEHWSLGRARRAVVALLDLSPDTARCISEGNVAEDAVVLPVEQVTLGAHVLVRPGEKIPLDGRVTGGVSEVNEAPITGESMPRTKQPGDEVFAGTINGDAPLELKVTRAADDTALARIVRMVQEAGARQAPAEQWVEKFARYYTPAMMAIALGIAVIPPLLGQPWTPWFYQALVVLVIACPCALVISTPVSIVSALTSAARHGVLIKGGRYLEEAARVRALAMDKTGTLTLGRPAVETVVTFDGHTPDDVLSRAAAMEAHSGHPIAGAILRRAAADDVTHAAAEEYRALPGKGAEGLFDGRPFWIGSHRFLHEKMDHEPDEVHARAIELEDAGHTVVAVGNEQHVCGLISVADEIRPDVSSTIAALKSAGLQPIVMLTGDNEGTSREVGRAVGVDDVRAELLPEDKVAAVESLRQAHGSVAMVGDGVNDAPALAASSLGIAMGAIGTDAAIETADVALMSDDLSKLPWLIAHARRTLGVIKQNVAFALGLKLLFLALATAGLATLWMAIAADMGASLLVVFNGMRLLRS